MTEILRPATPQARAIAKKEFPRDIQRGELNTWIKKRAQPISSFQTQEELFQADRKLFEEYTNLRNQYFFQATNRRPQPTHDRRKKFAPEATRFFDYLSQASIYYTSKHFDLDQKKFNSYSDSRFDEFQKLSSKKQENTTSTQTNETNNSPIQNQAAKQNPGALNALDQINQQTTVQETTITNNGAQVTQNSQGQAKDTSVPITSNDDKKDKIQKIIFPPIMIVKQAKLAKLKRDHSLNLKALREREKEIYQQEKQVRSFDSEKAPYIYSHQTLPKELQTRLDQAHEQLKSLEQQRTTAAQQYHKTATELTSMIINSCPSPNPVKLFDHQKRDGTTNYQEFQTKLSALGEASANEESYLSSIESALSHDAREVTELEDIIKALEQREYSKLKKLCNKAVLKDLNGDDININLIIKKLIKTADTVNELRAWLNNLDLDQTIIFAQKRFEELHPKDPYNLSISLDEVIDLNNAGFELMKAKLRKAYTAKKDPELIEKYQARIEKFKEMGKISAKEITMEIRRKYHNIRTGGVELPTKSVTGKLHNYDETITAAEKDFQDIHAYQTSNENQDGSVKKYWHYREVNGMDILRSIGAVENYARISARIIADPELIQKLDELAMKYSFTYKIPSTSQGWARADTLTIYLHTQINISSLSKKASNNRIGVSGFREICDAVKDYASEGDDKKLLGQAVLDNNNKDYYGIRLEMNPTINEASDLIARAYFMDSELGKIIQKELSLEIGNTSCGFSTSPGHILATRMFLDEIGNS
jgi:hypothetical protein